MTSPVPEDEITLPTDGERMICSEGSVHNTYSLPDTDTSRIRDPREAPTRLTRSATCPRRDRRIGLAVPRWKKHIDAIGLRYNKP